VPALKSCYTQADTIPELLEKIKEVVLLCLEAERDIPPLLIFPLTNIMAALKNSKAKI
jgi:predicted RNase H-like HicB family nuclease